MVAITSGGAAVAEPQINAEDINIDSLLANERVGGKIGAGLWAVNLTVRRPSGRIQVKKAEVEAVDDAGRVEKIDRKKVTKPCFIIDTPDDAEFWGLVDGTGRQAEDVITRFSVNDARKGFHLVPTSKLGTMLAQLHAIRRRRIDIVEEFRDYGYYAWIEKLRGKFNGHFYLIEGKIPRRDSLVEKFDMVWTMDELAPVNPKHIKFEDVNPDDQQAVIRESMGMAKQLVAQRAAAIYEEAFGVLLEKCEEIARGSMETGTRKFGGITELMALLDRAVNFQDFATDKSISHHAMAVKEQLARIKDVSEINANDGKNQTSAAIKSAFKPLGSAIEKMMKEIAPGSGRARRQVQL